VDSVGTFRMGTWDFVDEVVKTNSVNIRVLEAEAVVCKVVKVGWRLSLMGAAHVGNQGGRREVFLADGTAPRGPVVKA